MIFFLKLLSLNKRTPDESKIITNAPSIISNITIIQQKATKIYIYRSTNFDKQYNESKLISHNKMLDQKK